MKNLCAQLCAGLLLTATTVALARAQPAPPTPVGNSVPVTADNIIRAESDAVFTGLVAQGGFGKFYHNRELTPVGGRIVQRPNRDTLERGDARLISLENTSRSSILIESAPSDDTFFQRR